MKRRITSVQDGRMTIEEAFHEFLYEKKAINRAPQTIKDYEGRHNFNLLPIIQVRSFESEKRAGSLSLSAAGLLCRGMPRGII